MARLTIRLPDDKHERLKSLARQRGLSLNKLIEEWSTVALTEFDAETRFRLLAAKGDPERALHILDKLDAALGSRKSVSPPRGQGLRTTHRKTPLVNKSPTVRE